MATKKNDRFPKIKPKFIKGLAERNNEVCLLKILYLQRYIMFDECYHVIIESLQVVIVHIS